MTTQKNQRILILRTPIGKVTDRENHNFQSNFTMEFKSIVTLNVES